MPNSPSPDRGSPLPPPPDRGSPLPPLIGEPSSVASEAEILTATIIHHLRAYQRLKIAVRNFDDRLSREPKPLPLHLRQAWDHISAIIHENRE